MDTKSFLARTAVLSVLVALGAASTFLLLGGPLVMAVVCGTGIRMMSRIQKVGPRPIFCFLAFLVGVILVTAAIGATFAPSALRALLIITVGSSSFGFWLAYIAAAFLQWGDTSAAVN